MKTKVLFVLILTLLACSRKPSVEEAKQQILDTEKQFELMVKEQGIAKGFTWFAADSAVINRYTHLLIGKDSIMKHYSQPWFKDVELRWDATFVDVAQSCDLGYTYGTYAFTKPDSLGNRKTSTGIFHTVWKKQPDGSWRFVWD